MSRTERVNDLLAAVELRNASERAREALVIVDQLKISDQHVRQALAFARGDLEAAVRRFDKLVKVLGGGRR